MGKPSALSGLNMNPINFAPANLAASGGSKNGKKEKSYGKKIGFDDDFDDDWDDTDRNGGAGDNQESDDWDGDYGL